MMCAFVRERDEEFHKITSKTEEIHARTIQYSLYSTVCTPTVPLSKPTTVQYS
jgi:hypothetical protein